MKTNIKYYIIVYVSALLVFISSAFGNSLIIGYYPYWNYSDLPPASIKYNMVTHIIHAFIWPHSDGTLYIDKNIRDSDLIERAHNENVKVLIAIGGSGHNDNFDDVVSNSVLRGNFIQHLLDFCKEYGYDGIDMDWEPLNSSLVRDQLNILMSALKDSIKSQNFDLLLTIAVPATNWFGQWCDFDTLKNIVDWFNVMTYDFFWSTAMYANHNSPLYSPEQQQYDYGSVDSGLNYIHSVRGVPKEQIVLGIPFYGHACYATGLFELNTGYICWYSYSDILPMIGNGWNYLWDDVSKVPYLLNDEQTIFITYDDTGSVRLKCEYAADKGVAGVMIWEISKDMTGNNQPLLETIGKSMGLLPTHIVDVSKPEHIESFIKLKNYPNPFNNTTVISYFVSQTGKVTLEIFSVSGKKIETLINTTQNRGWHKTVFNTQSYASGEYIYRLATSEQYISKKMIIIK